MSNKNKSLRKKLTEVKKKKRKTDYMFNGRKCISTSALELELSKISGG